MKKYCVILLTCFSLFIAVSVLSFPTLATPPLSNSPSLSKNHRKAPVMLAHRWDQKIDIKRWWMSEKLDGVRGYWTGQKLISRSGDPFHVPKWFTKNFPSTPLDGELWLGRQQFSELVSIVRRKMPDAN
jgi:ATP-dependent DNA ligase